MPQRSYGYAAGRVGVLSTSLIDEATLERMMQAASIEEVARALADAGWGDARDRQEIERLCDRQLRAASQLVRDLSPDPAATDCFLIQYDVLNLKTLIKCRMLAQSPQMLSPCGVLDPEKLERMVNENRYADLPRPLRDAMERIEKRLAVSPDPLYVDAELDRAMAAFIRENLEKVRDGRIRSYFEEKIDMTNLLIALRSHRMNRGGALAREMLLPGGRVSPEAFVRVAEEPAQAYAAVMNQPYASRLAPVLKKDEISLSALEKAVDDDLLALLRTGKHQNDSILPLVGYLIARQREAGAVRLIVTAKAARMPAEEIAARLRRLY